MDSLWDDGDQWLLLYCISFTIANLTVLNLHNWSITRKSPKVADKSIDTGTFSFATLPPIQTRDSCVSTVSALSVDGDDADEESDKISQGCQTIRSNIHSKDASAETGNGWIDYFMLPKQLIRRQRKRSSFKRRAHGEQRPADYHWLWSNLPYRSTAAGPLINAASECGKSIGDTISPARMNRRLLIAAEIVNTERTYVNALDSVHENIYRPLADSLTTTKENNGGVEPKILKSKAALNAIFSNLQDIRNVNSELLAQLEERLFGEVGYTARNGAGQRVRSAVWDPSTGRLGDIFLLLTPFLRMYSIYVRNFNYALNYLDQEIKSNSAFKVFLESKKNLLGPLNVQSFLMMPIQRIPRYRLLLTDLLHHTPSIHPDHSALERALEMIESVAQFINEEIRSHENFMKIVDLQGRMSGGPNLILPGRRLIRSGRLAVILSKGHEQVTFFLFNDLLVHATITAGKSSLLSASAAIGSATVDNHIYPISSLGQHTNQEQYSFQRAIPLKMLRILDLPDEPLIVEETAPLCTTTAAAGRSCNNVSDNQPQSMRFLRNITPIPYSFLLLSKYVSFQVYCDSNQDKQCWLSDLNRAKAELKSSQHSIPLLFRNDIPSPQIIPTTCDSPAMMNVASCSNQNPNENQSPRPANDNNEQEEEQQEDDDDQSVLQEDYSFCAPVWIPDGAASNCMVCQQPFGLFRRRHHCRKCGIVCCADCSSRTFIVPSKTTVRIERACDPCYFQMFRMELSAAAEAAAAPTTVITANCNPEESEPRNDGDNNSTDNNGDDGSTTVDYSIESDGGSSDDDKDDNYSEPCSKETQPTATTNQQSMQQQQQRDRNSAVESTNSIAADPRLSVHGEFSMPDRGRVRSVTKSLLMEVTSTTSQATTSCYPAATQRRWSDRLLSAGSVFSAAVAGIENVDRQRAYSMLLNGGGGPGGSSSNYEETEELANECELCVSPFGVLRRRYQCEECWRQVCGYCAPRLWTHHKCDLCLYTAIPRQTGGNDGKSCRLRSASKLSTFDGAAASQHRLKRPRLGMSVRCAVITPSINQHRNTTAF